MALPFYGQISLGQVQSEYGGDPPTSISEYYRGGPYTPGTALKVPTGGQISFSQLWASNNTGTLTHVFDDVNNVTTLSQGSGATFVIQNQGGASSPWNGNFNYGDKYYTVYFNTPFPNTNYSINISIIDNHSASGVDAGVVFGAIGNKYPNAFDVQFVATNTDGISYVRSFSASCDWLG